MLRVFRFTLLWDSVPDLPAMVQDVTGAKDHPMVTCYPQSVIKWYDLQTFMV